MKLTNTLKISFRNILKNKTRSFLTSLGIIIGVSSVTIMVGIGQGTQTKIEKEIASMGTNLIIVFPGSRESHGVREGAGTVTRLTIDDVDRIRSQGTYIEAISPMFSSNEQVIASGHNWRTSINGVSTDYQTIKDYKLSDGEFFKDSEVKGSKSVAVIGPSVASELFPDSDAVGQKIRIGKSPFKIIGLLESKGQTSFGQDQDDVVLVPYTAFSKKVNKNRALRSIFISTTSADFIERQQEEIRTILRDQHKLRASDPDDFTIGNQTEITERATSITVLMTLLLGSIAAVSLVVGGIGIMNIMLVSVTERTREIGTRLAVGARGRDIMLQFLVESFVLSLSGGIIGILISFIAGFIVNSFTSISLVININIIIIAVVFSGSVGLFFGLYPARKAANLNPIDALRYE